MYITTPSFPHLTLLNPLNDITFGGLFFNAGAMTRFGLTGEERSNSGRLAMVGSSDRES